jgi:hypothetical protein
MSKTKAPEPIANLWVCLDCMLDNVNEGIALGYRVNGGTFACDATPDFGWTELESGDEYNYGEMEFSWMTCNACNSQLAGSRYRFAVWAWL